MIDNKNELKVIKTADGSFSIYNELLDETYHSKHGALQESEHVFIKNGFNLFNQNQLDVLEVGLGTGLNAALTYREAEKRNINTKYTALEPFPLSQKLIEKVAMGYEKEIGEKLLLLDRCDWEKPIALSNNFTFTKHLQGLQSFISKTKFDLIYFDAFAPEKQPDMWTLAIFSKLYGMLKQGGILTTYCAKGQVKRDLKRAGFEVKSVEGSPGKREMIVASKLMNPVSPVINGLN